MYTNLYCPQLTGSIRTTLSEASPRTTFYQLDEAGNIGIQAGKIKPSQPLSYRSAPQGMEEKSKGHRSWNIRRVRCL